MSEQQPFIIADRTQDNRGTFLPRARSLHAGHLHTLLFRSWKVLLPIAVMVILGVSGLEGTLSVPVFFIFFLSIGGLMVYFFARGIDRKVAFRLFISIYAYNVLVVVLFFFVFQAQYGNTYLSGGTDDMNFEYCGRYAAQSLKVSGEIVIPQVVSTTGLSPFRFERYRPYITLLAGVYYLSDMLANDMHTLNVRILNSLAIGLISVFAFLLAVRCGLSKHLSFIGAFAAGIYTPQAFWGAVIVRDVWVVLFCIATVYYFERLITSDKREQWKCLIMVFLMIYLISLFRIASAILMIGSLGLFGVFYTLKRKGVVVKTGLLMLYILLLLFLSFRLVGYYDEAMQFIMIRTEYRMQFAQGLSKYVFGVPFVPFGMIIRPFYALISPFPSFTLEAQHIFESVGTFGVILMLPFAFIGFFRSLSDRRKAILSIILIGLLLGVSWTTFHLRHLLVYMPYVFLLMTYGLSISKRPKLLFSIVIFMNMGLFLLYIWLKTFSS